MAVSRIKTGVAGAEAWEREMRRVGLAALATYLSWRQKEVTVIPVLYRPLKSPAKTEK